MVRHASMMENKDFAYSESKENEMALNKAK